MNKSVFQWILGAAGAMLLGVLIFSFRRVPRPRRLAVHAGAMPVVPRRAGEPTALLSGFDYAETTGGRTRFKIHADRTVGFSPAAGQPSSFYALETVTLTLTSSDGKPIQINSDRANYDPQSTEAHLEGRVEMHDLRGATGKTERADFDPVKRILSAPGAVEFSSGGFTGHAASGSFHPDSGEANFAGPITAQGNGMPPGPFSTLRGDSLSYRRDPPTVVVEGQVQGSRGTDTFSSDRLVLHLDGDNRIQQANADGSVVSTTLRTEGAPPRSVARTVSGDHATLDFDPPGELARMTLTGAPAKLHGETQDAAADRVVGIYGPGGELQEVRLSDHVTGTSPDGTGSAPEAVYNVARDDTILLSSGRQEAELISPRGKLLGRRIEIDSAASTVHATGSARAFFRGESSGRVPGFLGAGKGPTRGKADSIVLDNRRQHATLTGSSALWQGANLLVGDRIELDDAAKSVAASGSVRVVASSTPPEKRDRAGEIWTGTSDRMTYRDGVHTAVFEERVELRRGSSRAWGDRADVHFDASNRVDHSKITGHARFQDPPTGRSGSGDSAEDDPIAGRTVLMGSPATAVDGKGASVTGAVLTFEKASGTVEARPREGEKIETTYQTH